MQVVNLEEKFARFSERWKPKILASLNDYHVKAVKLQGEFVWHKHDETDELFLLRRARSGRHAWRGRSARRAEGRRASAGGEGGMRADPDRAGRHAQYRRCRRRSHRPARVDLIEVTAAGVGRAPLHRPGSRARDRRAIRAVGDAERPP
jgi:hypothetical protein